VGRAQAKGYFQLNIQPPGPGFLRMELVALPYGLRAERTRLLEVNGINEAGDTSVVREQEFSDGLAVSAQLGWRIPFLALRAGLIESRAGLGADVFLFDELIRLSAEGWDFSRGDLNPHAKLEAALHVYRALYLSGGWDDWLNTGRDLDSAYFGLSFRLGLGGISHSAR
jgi:hypothetical protein